jgi:hypothetical protein
MVLDGHEGSEYDRIIQVVPDFQADGTIEYLAIRDNTLYRVTQFPEK